jgi:hypothetical protein
MYSVIEKFAEVLSAPPEPILPGNRIGHKRPSTSSDIPMIVVSLTIQDHRTTGLGRVTRSGETLTRTTLLLEVRSTPETFSADLKRLRLQPLPLKKEQDVQIKNVTDSIHPTTYRRVDEPNRKDEYAVDATRAEVNFGQAQSGGEKLEVVHWTVSWRDDILGNAYRGMLNVELWSNSLNDLNMMSRKLQDRLNSNRELLRQNGFSRIQAASLAPVDHLLHNPAIGSPFPVWNQELSYQFAFEIEQQSELSDAGPIKRIDVDIDGHLNESLTVPTTNA